MKEMIEKVVAIPANKKDIVLLLVRLTLGIMFIQAGWGKFQNLDRTIGFFASIGIPFANVNAILAAGVELVGGLMVLLGYKMRYAILPMVFVMIVALLTAHLSDITSLSALFSLTAWEYLVMLLLLGACGAGKYALSPCGGGCCSKES